MAKENCKEILYAFFYAINKLSGRTTTQGIYNLWWEKTKCADTHLDPNKLDYERRYILKANSQLKLKKIVSKKR